MARTQHTTTIDDKIWNDFKTACTKNKKNMNDVLEDFMKHYAEGYTVTVSKEIKNKDNN